MIAPAGSSVVTMDSMITGPDRPAAAPRREGARLGPEAGRRRRRRGSGRGVRRRSVQEVIEQAIAVLGQHRLGMELHSVDRMLDMLDRHDLAVLGVAVTSSAGGTDPGAITSEW